MSACNFSLEHYVDLIRRFHDVGYRFKTFAGWEASSTAESRMLMRHDIDIDPFAALRMAEVEAEAGVRGTYFFLPTSSYYNLAAPTVANVLRSIERLGGDVQLHFDAAPYAHLSAEAIEDEIERQAGWVGAILGGKCIRVVSFHRPAPHLLDRDLDRFTSTYAPQFFREVRYISDSAGRWRDQCVCALAEHEPVVHCLIHPIWWVGGPAPVGTVLSEFLLRNNRLLDRWLQSEIRTYTGREGPS